MAFLCPLSFVLLLAVIFSAKAEEKLWPDDAIDFIVVGTGAAGAAVAARLSEKGHHQVLVLEAGGEPLAMTKIPYFGTGPFRGQLDWQFVTESQPTACLSCKDQKQYFPRGKVLGGSTIINAMVWTRGNRHDYDRWQALGNDGWSYEHVLPHFLRMENYQTPLIHPSDASFHNADGPMFVSRPPFASPLAEVFIEAGSELGFAHTDPNAAVQTGFHYPDFILRNGSRWSVYDGYLQPARQRPNVRVVTGALVTKVVINEAKRAVGVKFEKDGVTWIAKSKKEVILCAGAVGSPHLLLLSGIGPTDTLQEFKIPVTHPSPGVGKNLLDHTLVLGMVYTTDKMTGYTQAFTPDNMELWETKGEGPLTVPVRLEAGAFFNSRFADDDYPDLEILTSHPPVCNLGFEIEALLPFLPDNNREAYIVVPILLQPKSVGYLSLRSSDPHDPPLIQPRMLSDEHDVEALLDGLKFAHKILQTESFKKIGAKPVANSIPACADFERFSDDYFRCQIRHYSTHIFHPMGTCKMGPATDPSAVVDARLKVHGIEGLRVVDLSITPTSVNAPTMAAAIMIGEKGAAMILEDWQQKHQEL